MDNQTESRKAFEAEFRRQYSSVTKANMAMMLEQYNFGTDENPDWGYYSLAAREAWAWWQASRSAIVVDLEGVGYVQVEEGTFYLSESGVNENLRSLGITVKE